MESNRLINNNTREINLDRIYQAFITESEKWNTCSSKLMLRRMALDIAGRAAGARLSENITAILLEKFRGELISRVYSPCGKRDPRRE